MILVGSVAILLAKAARQPGWRAGTQNSGVPPQTILMTSALHIHHIYGLEW